MAAPVNDVRFSIAVYVVADDRETRFAQVPVGVPLPFVVIRIDVLKPTERCQNIHFAIAIDIGHASSVSILIVPADVMDAGLGTREIDPDDARPAIMSQRQIRLAIAVQVRHPTAFGVDGMSYEMTLPHHARLFGVLVPPQAVGLPANCDHIRRSVVIHVHGPFAAVGDEFI